MKSDFMLAITQLSAEKNLSKEVVLGAVESALVSAYRKNNFVPNQNIAVKINPSSGEVAVWAQKKIVSEVSDPRQEISLADARRLDKKAALDEEIMVESTPSNAGRIAAQTAKQVILQRLHDAEHSAIYAEYADKVGDIITGTVRRVDPRNTYIDLGRAEAMLAAQDQAPSERYRVGQRLKIYLVEVAETARGPQLIASRSHPGLLRRLFELEVPEIFNGTVDIKEVAREAGFRSKVAVAARQQGVDPVGCCVGLRGIRIQNIVNELNGEKIDVIAWNADPAIFITNALSPAHVAEVRVNRNEKTAEVIIPDKQLSLAIGKEGQNVRLAVKLTGWRIDIKSLSQAEEQRAEYEARRAAEEAEAALVAAEMAAQAITEEAPAPEPVEEIEAELIPITTEAEKQPASRKDSGPALRFAEDVLIPPPAKPEPKKKKKKAGKKEQAEDGIRLKRQKRDMLLMDDEDEYF
ncbi:MAG: transcription termination factor NusA [Dehalococcoidales bacterium]|jgi:N utilization substance protein A|nr:transcription termination factor NusA [Dehalococcoidales bacterium]MDD3265309.1 transcription termination factor NusA [Dehalococcoidales bacterium]MDD4322147.1 transcription termination factor NusA [Dehalococcoidales bacterium]MDD4793718.1 transcription termination factor NusA [Dehalococcoidales bacterium]MDD5122794.1 transcription termination factor NusA [Dehalococcoidales bacterium]